MFRRIILIVVYVSKTYMYVCLLTYLTTNIPTCLPTNQPVYLPVYLPTCLPTCEHTYLATYLTMSTYNFMKLLHTLVYPTTRSRPWKLRSGHIAHAQLKVGQKTASSAENRNRCHFAHAASGAFHLQCIFLVNRAAAN